MLQFQKPQTCHADAAATVVCVYVCVCSGRKSENNCKKTRDGSLKEAWTANAASADERQTKSGRQQAALTGLATHTHTHVAALLMLQAERVQLENGSSVTIASAESG